MKLNEYAIDDLPLSVTYEFDNDPGVLGGLNETDRKILSQYIVVLLRLREAPTGVPK